MRECACATLILWLLASLLIFSLFLFHGSGSLIYLEDAKSRGVEVVVYSDGVWQRDTRDEQFRCGGIILCMLLAATTRARWLACVENVFVLRFNVYLLTHRESLMNLFSFIGLVMGVYMDNGRGVLLRWLWCELKLRILDGVGCFLFTYFSVGKGVFRL